MNLKTLKIVETVKELLGAYGYVIYVWHVDDVHCICEQHNMARLSDEEAMQVFTIANEQCDGDVGMSWPQLERALHTYVKSKAAMATLYEQKSQA